MLREKVLPPISFTEHEAMALFFAGQSLRNYKSLPFENEVSAALHKLFHDLSKELKHKIERLQRDFSEDRIQSWIMRMDEHELVELVVELTSQGVRRCQSDVGLSRFIELRECGSGTIRTQISSSYLEWRLMSSGLMRCVNVSSTS